MYPEYSFSLFGFWKAVVWISGSLIPAVIDKTNNRGYSILTGDKN